MAKYTNSPIAKANLDAILTIPRSELPDSGSTIYPILYAIDTGVVYKFNPSLTDNGFLPTGASGSGRWQPLSPNTGWQFVNNDFTAIAGQSYTYLDIGDLTVTFPASGTFVKGQSIKLYAGIGGFRINSNSVLITDNLNNVESLSPKTGSYGGQVSIRVPENAMAEYVFTGTFWCPVGRTFTFEAV